MFLNRWSAVKRHIGVVAKPALVARPPASSHEARQAVVRTPLRPGPLGVTEASRQPTRACRLAPIRLPEPLAAEAVFNLISTQILSHVVE